MKELNKSLLAVLIVLCCVFGCSWYNSYKKNKQKEEYLAAQCQGSIRKAFIADSLAHDPHYQDSVRKAEEEYLKWKALHDSICREEVVGFIYLPDDDFYHSVFHSLGRKEDRQRHGYSIWDIPELKFMSKQELKTNHYEKCPTCKEIEDVYWKYDNGELIDVEDIREYIKDNSEDFEDLFENEQDEPDFDNDR